MADRTTTSVWSTLGVGLTILGSVAGAAAVVVWALADPLDDPVGGWLDWARDGTGRVAGVFGSADPDWQAMHLQVRQGDPARGRDVFARYGCGACHVIPGVSGATGTVGPSLAGFADRAYVAGILTNAPGDLTRWLIDPPLFAPDTAMPDLGVTESDADDMAAYLYTLERDG